MKVMIKEAGKLKNELEKTRNLVELQQMRYQQLVSMFQVRLREKEEETRCDLQNKHTQLTRVLHSLYILEAKLRKEQRVLKSALEERDALLNRQENEIHKLKSELHRLTSYNCACGSSLKSIKNTEESHREPDNKPDLISSIAIEVLKSDNGSSSPPSKQLEGVDDTYLISSQNKYQHSWPSSNAEQHLKEPAGEFKSNQTSSFVQSHSPHRLILEEVTKDAEENFRSAGLNCLSQDVNSSNCIEEEGNIMLQANKSVNLLKTHKSFFKRPSSHLKPTTLPINFLAANDTSTNSNVQPAVEKCIEKSAANVKEESSLDESKIVQTVSAVLSNSAGSDDEQAVDTFPTVSQMVKKFENMKRKRKGISSKREFNNTSSPVQISSKPDSAIIIHNNFEEFYLVDKEINSTCQDITKDDATRLQADQEDDVRRTITTAGSNAVEDSVTAVNTTSNSAKYETFLELTGLSQKSILTPSRILSNHRNVMKPKDVKYRSRVKAAVNVISDKCSAGNAVSDSSSTMKYWTEPYL